MLNPLNQQDRSRFWKAHQQSKKYLEPFLKNRKEVIEDYVGDCYGEVADTNTRKVYANLMAMTADIYTMALAAERPRVQVQTFSHDLIAFSKTFQVAINSLLERIRFEDEMRAVVLDAFFGLGIGKLYLAPSDPVPVFNPEFPPEPSEFDSPEAWAAYAHAQAAIPQHIWVDPGRPMFERVSPDEFVFDMTATEWSRIRYATHRYQVPFEDAKRDDRFDRKVVRSLAPDSKQREGENERREGAVSELSARNPDEHEDLEPMLTLFDVWLPRENRWGVMSADEEKPPLYMAEWDGQPGGPFGLLSFIDVPDNIMPASMAQHLKHLHRLANHLIRKSAARARNQKTLLTYQGHEKDARNIIDAKDMQAIQVANPDSVREMAFNGPDNLVMAFGQMVDGLYSRMAGNLDAMAGLGPQAQTATQDALVHGSVSKLEAKRKFRVNRFAEWACRGLGHYLWHDVALTLEGQREIPGIQFPVEATWTPYDREGDFESYRITVEPHSMAYKSPAERFQSITHVLTQVYLPMLPLLQQSGGTINMAALTEKFADLLDLPELTQIVTFLDALPPDGGGEAPGMPAHTQREYTRRNIPTNGTPQSQRSLLAQALTGGNVNADQRESLAR